MMTRRSRPHISGFTLIETTVAVAVSSILLLALGSVVVVAARVIPTGEEPIVGLGATERALALVQSDLEEATELAISSGRLIIAVSDRDADGVGEVIEFRLDANAMLTRTQNGGPPEVLAGPVKDFGLDMVTSSGRVDRLSVSLIMPDLEPGVRTLNVRLLNRPAMR